MSEILSVRLDPATATVLAGLVWPLVQAALDRVEWTPGRRRVVALVAAFVIAVVVWGLESRPDAALALTTHLTSAAGATQIAFVVLKQLGVIDWVGAVSPGGESHEAYRARHRGEDA